MRELHIDLDFEKSEDNRYHLSKSNVAADASVTKNSGTGFFGERTVSFKNFTINKPLPDTVYDGPATVKVADVDQHPDTFWQKNRHDTLTKTESKIYSNIDSLEKMPSFRRTLAFLSFLLAG